MPAYLEFNVPGREEPIRRTWPVVPEIGSRVFLEEIVGEVAVRGVVFGAVFDGPLTVAGSCTAAIECAVPDDEDAPETLLVVPDFAEKLRRARTYLYDVKNAVEQGAPRGEISSLLVCALDATRTPEPGESS